MIWVAVAAAASEIANQAYLDRLPPEEREKAITKQTEERRHQELCDAIRYSQRDSIHQAYTGPSSDSYPSTSFLYGFLLGEILGEILK